MHKRLKTLKKIKCYICGSGDYSFPPGSVRDNPKLKILKCNSCGLIFLSDSGQRDEVFYANSGMHEALGEKIDPGAWLKEVKEDDQRRFNYFKPLINKKAVLDFGCGAGGFLIQAKKVCGKAFGVEPEKRLQRHFYSKGLEVYPDLKAFRMRYPKGFKVDVVTLFHVLEHLPDPRRILNDLSSVIKNNGQIIIEVPHASDALLVLYKSDAFSHFTYWSCHLYIFTIKALEKLIKQSGLRVNYIKQIQRYPLSNHLYWLAKGEPKGHLEWGFLNSDELQAAYEKQLAALGCCDTLVASIRKS